jgi:hypothetical protein
VLLVAARMDSLPLHRYRLAGELTEIRASDLAFTVPEAGQLMARHGITVASAREGQAETLRPAPGPPGPGGHPRRRDPADLARLAVTT